MLNQSTLNTTELTAWSQQAKETLTEIQRKQHNYLNNFSAFMRNQARYPQKPFSDFPKVREQFALEPTTEDGDKQGLQWIYGLEKVPVSQVVMPENQFFLHQFAIVRVDMHIRGLKDLELPSEIDAFLRKLMYRHLHAGGSPFLSPHSPDMLNLEDISQIQIIVG